MKQINLIILSVLLALTVFGQQDNTKSKTASPKLLNVKNVFSIANFDRTRWSLYTEYNDSKYAPTKAEDVMSDIDDYLLVTPTENKRQGEILEFELIKKYRTNIDTTFQGLKLFGSDNLGEFLYSKKIALPVHFGMLGDTALSFIISGVYIGNVYNTLKFTNRQRAKKVVTTYILPSLKAFSKSFSGKEVKYFGITCIYGSKNFADDGALATKPEFVAFIASAKSIRQFVSGDLTEDDLINSADIYVCDRDMVAEIKKIKIILE
jgi:hypothetical protein